MVLTDDSPSVASSTRVDTTTLRMLVTLLTPTTGTARVAGYDVATQPVQVRRSIGYCSQVGSWWGASVFRKESA